MEFAGWYYSEHSFTKTFKGCPDPYQVPQDAPPELISEVVEIEKAQVRERAYPPGITNRR